MANSPFNLYSRKRKRAGVNILQVSVSSGGALPVLRKLSSRITQLETINQSFHRIIVNHCQTDITILHISHEIAIDRTTSLLNNLYRDAKGLCIIIDLNEEENVSAGNALLKVLQQEELLKGIPLLVLVKVKPERSETRVTEIIEEVTNKLSLNEISQRPWHVIPSDDISPTGLKEGLDWLLQSIA